MIPESRTGSIPN